MKQYSLREKILVWSGVPRRSGFSSYQFVSWVYYTEVSHALAVKHGYWCFLSASHHIQGKLRTTGSQLDTL